MRQLIEGIPDIFTLLRLGHFYFALTSAECFSCYTSLVVVMISTCDGSGGGEGIKQKVDCLVFLSKREVVYFLKNIPLCPPVVIGQEDVLPAVAPARDVGVGVFVLDA
jgi:hypothetical protein